MTRNPPQELTATAIESRSLLLADAIPNLVFLASEAGVLTYGNPAWSAYTGLEPAGGLPPHLAGLVHANDREAFLTAWQEAQSRNGTCDLELRLLRADGVYRWHLLRLVPFDSAGDHPGNWLGSATDIDNRHRVEEVNRFFARSVQILSESLNYNRTLRKLARLLVPASADICTVDVLDDDRSIKRIEIACSDPAKADLVQELHPRDWLAAPGGSQTIGQVIAGGGPVFLPRVSDALIDETVPDKNEAALVKKLGASSAIFVPLRARNRTLGALALVTTDSGRCYTEMDVRLYQALAERAGVAIENARLHATSRRVARELRVASRAKDEFLGLMSHELRTPITTIYGNARVLQRLMNDLDRDALASAVADIRNDSERLHLIIENLLALARSEGRDTDVEPVLVARLLRRLQEAHMLRHPYRRTDLQVNDPGICVTANATYIDLVVHNLLSNAEKYSPREQPIEIRLDREGDEMVVRVLDRGRGIPPAEIEAIFHPFFRSSVNRDEVSGIGIGLTVCKRLMEAQGGRIWALPREDGGSELGIALPVEAAADITD